VIRVVYWSGSHECNHWRCTRSRGYASRFRIQSDQARAIPKGASVLILVARNRPSPPTHQPPRHHTARRRQPIEANPGSIQTRKSHANRNPRRGYGRSTASLVSSARKARRDPRSGVGGKPVYSCSRGGAPLVDGDDAFQLTRLVWVGHFGSGTIIHGGEHQTLRKRRTGSWRFLRKCGPVWGRRAGSQGSDATPWSGDISLRSSL